MNLDSILKFHSHVEMNTLPLKPQNIYIIHVCILYPIKNNCSEIAEIVE